MMYLRKYSHDTNIVILDAYFTLFLGVVSKEYLKGMDLLDVVSYYITRARGDRTDTQHKVFFKICQVFTQTANTDAFQFNIS